MSPSQPAKLWMTATCAIHMILTRRAPRHDLLGGTPKTPESTTSSRAILGNSWGVTDAASLRQQLAHLRDAGDRSEYAPRPGDGLSPQGMLAWDLERLVSVAGWGYVADFISEDEAWSFIAPAAAQLQRAYTSWEDYGNQLVKGAYAWNPAAGEDCDPKCKGLLSDPASPWRTIPWATDLGGIIGSAAPVVQGRAQGLTAGDIVKSKVSSFIWGWVITGVIGIVAIVAIGVTILHYAKGTKTNGVASARWDGKTPFSCAGNEEVSFTGVTANVSGTAITARGNCHVKLTGGSITAAVAIDAAGNARVTMTGGTITASSNSVVAAGGAEVSLVGTHVSGKSKASGGAKVTGAN